MTANPFFGDRMPVWAELDELLSLPEFAPDLGGVGTTYRRLRALGGLLGPATALHHRPDRLLAAMEWAAVVDPPLMHAAMVHFGVATTALVECGHPGDDLDPLLADLDAVAAPGVIVATELGRGGSQIAIRTEARYDRDRRVFTLRTPDDAALKIMPNVGWTGLDRTAVVTARLVVDGADHGVHAFACRLPHPDVQIRTLPGHAPVPLDYAVIRFRDAEIPLGCWLSDTAAITGTGVDDPLSAPARLARSLGGVNAAVTSAAVALAAAARAAVAVTARYAARRRIGADDTPALAFPTHSVDLATACAAAYAISSYVDKVRQDFIAERRGHTTAATDDAVATADHAPWLAANRDRTLAKAAATTALERVTATGRRLSGFQGVLHTNRIAAYEDMARSFHAAGGDTRLLLLEAGKQLLHRTDAPATGEGTRPDDPRFALRLVSLQERTLAARLRHNPHPHGIEHLAQTHIARRSLEELSRWTTTAPTRWRPALDAVASLHGVDTLLSSAAWHLDHGSLRPGDLDVLDRARTDAAGRVVRRLDTLTDGLAVPPGRVGGFIGRADYVARIAAYLR